MDSWTADLDAEAQRIDAIINAEDVRDAYTELATKPGAWVSLSRLRTALADMPRAEFDAAILRLALEVGVHLNPEFNQKTLTPQDRAAAIRTGGENVHLLSIRQP